MEDEITLKQKQGVSLSKIEANLMQKIVTDSLCMAITYAMTVLHSNEVNINLILYDKSISGVAIIVHDENNRIITLKSSESRKYSTIKVDKDNEIEVDNSMLLNNYVTDAIDINKMVIFKIDGDLAYAKMLGFSKVVLYRNYRDLAHITGQEILVILCPEQLIETKIEFVVIKTFLTIFYLVKDGIRRMWFITISTFNANFAFDKLQPYYN